MERKNDYLLVFFDEPLAIVWNLRVLDSGAVNVVARHDLAIGSYDLFDLESFLTKISSIYKIEPSKILSLSSLRPKATKEKVSYISAKFVDYGKLITRLLESDSMESGYKSIFLFFGRKIVWGIARPVEEKKKKSFKFGIIDLSDFKDWVECMRNKMVISDRFFLNALDEGQIVSGLVNSYLYPGPLGDRKADGILASAVTVKLFFASLLSINSVFSDWFQEGIKSKFHQVDIGIGGHFVDRIESLERYLLLLEGLSPEIDKSKNKEPFTVTLYKADDIFVPLTLWGVGIEGYEKVSWNPVFSYHSVYIADQSVKKGDDIGIVQVTDVGKRYSSRLKVGELLIEALTSEAFIQTIFDKKCFCHLDSGRVSTGIVAIDCGTGLSTSFLERFSNYFDYKWKNT